MRRSRKRSEHWSTGGNRPFAWPVAESHGLPARFYSAGFLRNVATAERFSIFQDLGPGSTICYLDGAGALTAARSSAARYCCGVRPCSVEQADALRAVDIGVDGIIVSNHGGRQLDQAPGSLDVLPAVKEAVGDRLAVVLDSGVRRGADIPIALCLGAQFVFMGRPTLYGAAAGGIPEVNKAISILVNEIDLVMGQIGCPSLDQLGPDFLWLEEWQRNK